MLTPETISKIEALAQNYKEICKLDDNTMRHIVRSLYIGAGLGIKQECKEE